MILLIVLCSSVLFSAHKDIVFQAYHATWLQCLLGLQQEFYELLIRSVDDNPLDPNEIIGTNTLLIADPVTETALEEAMEAGRWQGFLGFCEEFGGGLQEAHLGKMLQQEAL